MVLNTLRNIFAVLLLSVVVIANAPTILRDQQITVATLNQIKFVQKYKVSRPQAEKIVNVANEYAARFDMPADQLLALMAIESSFNQHAQSKAGAVGYVQHIDKWHPEKVSYVRQVLGYYDRFEMRANMMMGVLISKEYQRRYGSKWLQAYNGSLKDRSMKYTNKFNHALQELTA